MFKNIANHSEPLLRLNLQYFSDGEGLREDAILPDDFEDTSIDESIEEQVEEPVSEEVDTNETEQTEEPTQEEIEAFLKIKYNKEEIALDQEQAKELAQKGLNYDKVQERLQSLESDPRLSFVESLAQEQGMSVDQFLDSFNQAREQERLNELIQNNIPEELAQEILENRKFREQYESKQKESEQQAQQEQELQEFIQTFPNLKAEEIPQSVWEMNAQGTPLKFAMMQHQFNEMQNQIKVLKQNETNKKKAPVGSITAHGSNEVASEDDFLRGFNSI